LFHRHLVGLYGCGPDLTKAHIPQLTQLRCWSPNREGHRSVSHCFAMAISSARQPC
jgi:hypothetical protein